jgi:hypothetical protein
MCGVISPLLGRWATSAILAPQMVVSNGLTASDYQLGSGLAHVPSSTAKSTFTIFTVDGSTQVCCRGMRVVLCVGFGSGSG